MKKRLLFAAALALALVLPFSRKADAQLRDRCYDENYGSGQCGTTCVFYNDQGSVFGWATTFHGC
jgi:hypothetical protein